MSASGKTHSTKNGYTEPKGRPTVHATDNEVRNRISPTMEWVIVGVVLVAILGGIFYAGRDLRGAGHGGGGGGHGAPADVPALVADVDGAA